MNKFALLAQDKELEEQLREINERMYMTEDREELMELLQTKRNLEKEISRVRLENFKRGY